MVPWSHNNSLGKKRVGMDEITEFEEIKGAARKAINVTGQSFEVSAFLPDYGD